MTAQLSDLLLTLPLDEAYMGFIDFAQGAGMDLGASEQMHIHMLLSGELEFEIDDRRVSLASGDILLVNRCLPYRLLTPGGAICARFGRRRHLEHQDHVGRFRIGPPGRTVAVSLSGSIGLLRGVPYGLTSSVPNAIVLEGASLTLPGDKDAGGFTQTIVDASAGPGGRAVAAAFFNLIYVHALRTSHLKRFGKSEIGIHLRAHKLAIEAGLRVMDQRMSEPWTLARLAEVVGMSRSRFAAEFKATIGETPLHYLTRKRHERAAKLLADPSIQRSVAEVAALVGYRSQAAFSRAYAAQFACLPRASRLKAISDAAWRSEHPSQDHDGGSKGAVTLLPRETS